MSRHLPPRLLRLAGPTPLVRRLSTQSVLSAFGDGVFLTGSAVFFTQIVGLSAARVGLGLTIAGVVTFLVAVPLGKLSDRFGAKRVWAISSLIEAVLYLAWLQVGGMVGFVAVMVAVQIISTASRSARNAYRFDVFPREQRVTSNAYFRAARNVGYTLGALLAGVALATNSDDVIRLVPAATAALLLVNATLVARLPQQGRARGGGVAARSRARRARAQQRAAEPRLPADVHLRRRARHPSGPAQRRDPALAGRGDGRAPGAAGLAVRDQHRPGGPAAGGRGPRRRDRRRLPASDPTRRGVLRPVLRHRRRHPRHHRLGHDRPGVDRSRHRDRRRALRLRRRVGTPGRALRPGATW